MMKEEIAKVLEMVQAGRITAQEGQQLLEAMGAYEEPAPAGKGLAARKAAKLYVKVDSANGDKVNVALPLTLIKSGMNLGFSIGNQYSGGALKDIDLEEVMRLVDEMAAEGGTGDIVNVESADGDRVHIYLE